MALEIGIIGLGGIVREYHLPALHSLGYQVRWACDPSHSGVETLRRYFPTAEFGADAAPYISRSLVPAVLVASPTALHAAHVAQCLEAKVSVFCEKPLACHAAEARQLVALATTRQRVVQAGYYRRHFPNLRTVGELMANESFGAIRGMRIRGGDVAKNIPASFLHPELSGGGVLMDFGVHVFDLLQAWSEAVEFDAYADDAQPGGIEANACIRLTCRIGQRRFPVVVELSRTQPIGFSLCAEFADGTVTADLNFSHVLAFTSHKAPQSPLQLAAGAPQSPVVYFAEEWREFAARLSGAPEQRHRIDHAVAATELAERCYAQRRTMEFPWGD